MKNNLWIGMAIGLIFPMLAYLLTTYTTMSDRMFATKPFLLYIVAGAINLVLIRLFYRKTTSLEKSAKGVMLVTFLGMLVFLRIYLRADGAVAYARVMEVMGALNAAGFHDIVLVTDAGGPRMDG